MLTETETLALRSWLARQGSRLVTNSVGVVELQRLAARVSQEAERTAALLLNRIDQVSVDKFDDGRHDPWRNFLHISLRGRRKTIW